MTNATCPRDEGEKITVFEQTQKSAIRKTGHSVPGTGDMPEMELTFDERFLLALGPHSAAYLAVVVVGSDQDLVTHRAPYAAQQEAYGGPQGP